MARQETTSRLQERAWGFYGWPGSADRAVGEVRYVVGWLADQMTRLEWDVFIDGSDEWTVPDVKVGDETITISTTREDGEQDQTAASMDLLALIDWDERTIRAITTNLFVGGQGNFIKEGDRWRVVSVVESRRKETLEEAALNVPFIWPHPADPKKPDAPLFAVLDVLDDLQWLSRQARTQSKQRALTSGFLLVADGFQGPNGADVWEQFNTATSARMRDEDDLSPIRFQGPHDLVKDGVNWIKPDLDYDAVIDRRIMADIERVGYGLPIPKEILTGMQAQAMATAFQVEDCLAPSTKVLTADLHWVEVGTLKEDDLLVAFDEEVPQDGRRKWRTATVERAGRGYRPCFKVTLSDGTEIVASENHQWLMRDTSRSSKWVTTAWLKNALTQPQRKHGPTIVKVLDVWEPLETREAGYLAGVFDGEGYCAPNTAPQFGFKVGYGQRENACKRTTETLMAELGFDLHNYGATKASVNGDCFQQVIRGGQSEVLRFLGQIRPERLLDNYESAGGADQVGAFLGGLLEVVAVEPVGEQEVVTLRTSTGTLIAEGLAHHNSGYKAHIEPPAGLVGQVGQDALTLVLGGRVVEVRPNPSQLLARKQSVEDVKWARENGLVDPDYVREVLGIPEDAAPEEGDGVPISAPSSGQRDPANVAADEPVTAAASEPNLTDLLAEIDKTLSFELSGATVMATDRARQRLGAAARANGQGKALNGELRGLSNAAYATHLGLDGLLAAGVDVDAQIAEPIGAATEWWVRRVGQVWEQMGTIIPGWAGQGAWIEESVERLANELGTHISGTLAVPEPLSLNGTAIRHVLNAAAGGAARGVR